MVKTGVVNGRFQVLHLKHMEYILAAKMRCQKLYIGLSNPDTLHTKDSPNDIRRSEPSSNPLTYHERCEMVKGAMQEFNVPDREYEFVPFPINYPEHILQYVPKDATFFLGMYDEWDEEKYRILSNLDVDIEILWDRPVSQKGIVGEEVREKIAMGEDWTGLVPKNVYLFLTEQGLDQKIRRLIQTRMAEKEFVPMKDTASENSLKEEIEDLD